MARRTDTSVRETRQAAAAKMDLPIVTKDQGMRAGVRLDSRSIGRRAKSAREGTMRRTTWRKQRLRIGSLVSQET